MKYFIAIGNNKKGPYSLEEIKEYKLERNTLIWKEGTEDWKNAEEFEEFKEFFILTPPPIPGVIETQKPRLDYKKKAQKELNKVLWLFLISLTVSVLTLIFYSSANRPEYVSAENIEKGIKEIAQSRFKGETITDVGNYIPNGKYSYGFTTQVIEDGNVNEIVRSRYQSDVTNKTLIAFGLSFGILIFIYFISKAFKHMK